MASYYHKDHAVARDQGYCGVFFFKAPVSKGTLGLSRITVWIKLYVFIVTDFVQWCKKYAAPHHEAVVVIKVFFSLFVISGKV